MTHPLLDRNIQRPWMHWPADRSFKPQFRPPVRGGRWHVRRRPLWMEIRRKPQPKPWRAWTNGSARRWNRHFETHAEAMAHADLVSRMYLEHGNPTEANYYIKLALPIR